VPYSFVNLSTARQQLSNRLYDSSQVFWPASELTAIIQEALRTWNAITSMWRGEFTFALQNAKTFYDLTVVSNTLRPLTVTDTSLVTAIEAHLLEPQTAVYPLTWSGSVQYSLDDILNAIQRRRDEVLSITGCSITRRTIAMTPGRIALPDTVLDVRRLAYLPASGSPYVIWRDDVWGLQSYESAWPQSAPGQANVFSVSTEPPLTFDVDVTPNVNGQYELLTVESGGNLSTAQASTFTIPDDWMWVVKWGALADLFGRESNANDALRMQYCESRYRQAVQWMMDAPALLAARLNNVPLQVDAVREADNYRTNWQAETPTQPTICLTAGLNLVGFAAPPDAGAYTITATVVENAPIPVADGDNIQMGRDDYAAMLDYCVHVAMLKCGGAEFADTMPLYDRFLKQAKLYNSKLDVQGGYTSRIFETSAREEKLNPRMANA
jgi:hypothetical protein